MARQVLPIVGAAIGGYFGGPQGAQIGYMIGSIIGNAVDPQIIKGPSIGDGVLQTSKEGVPRPIVYGTGCIAGNLIDRGEIRKWKKRTRQGKGGPVQEEERMSLTFAIRICEGPIGGILRIWEDEKLVYDIRPNSEIQEDTARYAAKFRFYDGSETQLPDPDLEAIRDPGKTPSYRGTAYIVFPDLDVTDRRGSVPNFRFEVVSENVATRQAVVATSTTVFELNEEGILTPVGEGPWTSKEAIYLLQPGLSGEPRRGDAFSVSYDAQYFAGVFVTSTFDPNETGLRVKRFVDGVYEDCTVAELPSKPIRAVFSPVRNFLCVLCAEHLVLLNVDGSNLFILESQVHSHNFTNDLNTGNPTPGAGIGNQAELSWKWDGTMVCFVATEFSAGISTVYMGRIRVNSSGFDPGEYVFVEEVFTSGSSAANLKEKVDLSHSWGDRNDVVFWTSCVSGVSEAGPTIAGIGEGIAITSVSSDPDFLNSDSELRRCFFLPDGNVGVIGPGLDGTGIDLWSLETEIVSNARVFTGEKTLLWSSASSFPVPVLRAQVIRANTGSGYLLGFFQGGYASGILSVSQSGTVELVGYSITSSAGPGFGFVSGQATLEPGTAYLADIVRDVTLRSKVNVDALDLVDVEDTVVRGFIVANAYNANNVIRSLQETFLFDPAEWDKKIHLVPRGKPVVAVLTEDDLIDEPTEETRENAREYPQKLELFYQNPDVGYAAAKAPAERVSQEYELSGTKSMESPVTMIVDEAWKLADIQLKVSWEEAKGNVVLRVSSDFDFLTPTDCIGFYRRGVGSRLRIHKIEKAAGVITLTCRHDRQSAYNSTVTGLPVIPPTPPPSSITGETIFQFLNIPALVDNLDPLLHYYYGATGTSDAWYGAVIDRAVDDDEFEEVSRITTNSRMGVLVDPLPYASEHYPDTTNEIVVEMFRNDDNLDAVSMSQLLRERNGAALSRADGTAELIQFRDVEDLGNRRYRLGYILRGRLNSGAGSHAAGTPFTLLDDVLAVTASPALIGAELLHRPTSFNESAENSDIYTHDWDPPLSQVEWPVALLEAERVGDTINITWSPRERFGTDVNPIRSVNWQSYRVTVTDGTNSTTFDVLNPNATLDVTGWGPLTISVSQVNRFTGPGPASVVTA